MRRDAGRTFEIQIWFAGACLLSLVAGAVWKPWGYLAGPALLVVAVGGAMIGSARAERSARHANEALLQIAANPSAAPPRDRLRALVEAADPAEPRLRFAALKAAGDRSHPAREAFCTLALRMEAHKNPRAQDVLAAFVLDHPTAEFAAEFARVVVSDADPGTAERVARAALAAGTGGVARIAARQLVFRATTTWEDGHERLAAVARELRDRIAPLLDEADVKKRLDGLA